MGGFASYGYRLLNGALEINEEEAEAIKNDAALIRRVIQNPVYCGKIAYGRRRTEKVHGIRNDCHLVEKDGYILADGLHEGVISEDDWQAA